MSAGGRWSLGLLGRILAILLLAVVVEFGVSTLLYERASRLSVHEDEAHRLAENLALAVKFFNDTPMADRHALADRLSTDRYIFTWHEEAPRPPLANPALSRMRLQVTAWEPSLVGTQLRLRVKSPGRSNVVIGNLRLRDGTGLEIHAPHLIQSTTFTINRIALALAPAIALVVIGALLTRVTLRPIRELVKATGEIGHGGTVQLAEKGPAEVRRLTRAFNEMQARITTLIEGRTRALAGVGHDLRTPIARLRLRTDMIDDPQVRKAFAGDLVEIEGMLNSLLAYFGRDVDPEARSRVDLAVMLSSMVDELADEGKPAEYQGPDHCEAVCRKSEIKRAVSNLIENAIHYGGRAIVGLRIEGPDAAITVDDEGPGIPEDAIAMACEPFVRLDAARARNTNGLGLGLSIVTHAAASAGGRFSLANRPEGGLRATLVLPLQPLET